MDVTLIGTQHEDPRLQERIEDVFHSGPGFDAVFVEGVDQETGKVVGEYVDKWVAQVSENLGLQMQDYQAENGRLSETEIVEETFDGEVNYLDTGKTAFQNVKDRVTGTLRKARRGEVSTRPELLLEEDASQEDFEAVMQMYTPEPDLPYRVFAGEMSDEQYRTYMKALLEDFYRDLNQVDEVPGEVEESLERNAFQKAPSQARLRELFVNETYSNEHEQEREQTWLQNFEEAYNGEQAAVFTGLAHLEQGANSFYDKLTSQGYDVDRKVLKDFQDFAEENPN